ncbi:hypothetical protein SLE2022_006480 [Rubroshorea leprosula]
MLQPSRATHGMMSVQSFTYKELEKATKHFEEVLGKGASSTVYKGVLGEMQHGNVEQFKVHVMQRLNAKKLCQRNLEFLMSYHDVI